MTKILTVASEVQKALFVQVILPEMNSGFWHDVRPADHAAAWIGVEVQVGDVLGAEGFKVPRNYNFVNPIFLKDAEERLVEAAQTVDPNATFKQVKKHLIMLSRTVGGRIKAVDGPITKLARGRKASDSESRVTKSSGTVRRVPATFAEPTSNAA